MRPLFALAALVALTVACGGGNTPTSPSLPFSLPGSSSLNALSRGIVRATVDGTPWESASVTALVGSSIGGFPPLLTLTALPRTSGYFLSISGPAAEGTHVSSGSTFVAFSLTLDSANRWSVSPFDASTNGTLTITTVTATRVAGTFSFTAAALSPGGTPATRTVTNGTFDVSR
jgi:hypothetical protein